jgi:hypothetical protein
LKGENNMDYEEYGVESEEAIDYEAIVKRFKGEAEQLLQENERLRERLSSTRRFDVSLEKVKLEAAKAVQSPYFWAGYWLAIIAMGIIGHIAVGYERD